MELASRPNTVPAAFATLGLIQLTGVAYTAFVGFDASQSVAVGWSLVAIVAMIFALGGSRLPGWIRGITIGITYYSAFQVGAYLLLTPSPPTTTEYIFAILEGVGLLVVAVMMKRWVDAGVRAAQLDTEVLDERA